MGCDGSRRADCSRRAVLRRRRRGPAPIVVHRVAGTMRSLGVFLRLPFPSLLPFCHTFPSPSLTVLLSYKSSCAVGLGSAVDGYAQSSAALPSNGIWTWCTVRAIFSYRIDVDSLIFMNISRLAAYAGCSGRRGQIRRKRTAAGCQ